MGYLDFVNFPREFTKVPVIKTFLKHRGTVLDLFVSKNWCVVFDFTDYLRIP